MDPQLQAILITLAFGAVAGWLASLIFRGTGYGLIGDIIIGILGAVVGHLLLGWLNLEKSFTLHPEWLRQLIVAVGGALVLLLVIKLVFPGKKK